jgi:hypothetical protein
MNAGRVPLISRITKNLWMGGCDRGEPLPRRFAFVVSLCEGDGYLLDARTTRIQFVMEDAHYLPDLKKLYDIAHIVQGVAADPTSHVLVHCNAGLNRSGLVLGMALVLMGWHAHDAVDTMRAVRSEYVLSNQTFYNYLMEFKTQ